MSRNSVNPIAGNIQHIRERITLAAESCGRRPEEIILLAISKTFPREAITEALAAGIRQFGESRAQEAEAKIPHFAETAKPEWHLIGHLQSNKTRRAVELFDVIQSVDSAKLAARISQAALELGKTIPILLQVDLGDEETKFGVTPDEVRGIIEAISDMKGVRLDGLMTLPPYFENQEEARPFFYRLRELGEKLETERSGCLGKRHLSMGMSHDFEAAIREGATIVRVGTAIFGIR
ncbi:MAG: YggS family pyridoxal phosphate-dependent enzyme [Acidobacteriota bacterium]|jgi:pyridoxal phosphate enzyme (YggS family)|nr:YggS family pyridoxal phosphate-dependent enzyme [Acidobacteriota bacterium]